MKLNFDVKEIQEKGFFGSSTKYRIGVKVEYTPEEKEIWGKLTYEKDKMEKRIVHQFSDNSSISFFKVVREGGSEYEKNKKVSLQDLMYNFIYLETTHSDLVPKLKDMLTELYKKYKKECFETSVEL